jgi:hypothetical protein
MADDTAEARRARAAESRRRWKAANRAKILEQRRQRYAANRDKMRAQGREQARRRREREPGFQNIAKRRIVHGPNWAQVVAGFKEAQEDRCYLCGDPLDWDTSKAVAIDHDHRCCPPARSCDICRRGLACTLCNKLIGLAYDDVARLRRIADALEIALGAFEERFVQAPQQGTMF